MEESREVTPELTKTNAKAKDTKVLAILAAVIGQTIWGFSYLFTRLALDVASPEILLSIRFLVSFMIMNLMLLTGKQRVSFKGKSIKPLILLAIAEPAYFFFESYGILYSNATFAGVILAVVPIVAMALAALTLKEYPTRRQVFFAVFPIVGVIIITVTGSKLGIIKPIGVVLLVCTCLTSSTYRIFNRKTAEEFSPFERTYAVLFVTSVVFTASALISVRGDISAYLAPLASPAFVLPLLALCLLCSITANLLVNYASGIMSVAKLAVFGAVSTVCSTFAGVVFLGEPITPMIFLGAALIIFGIWQVVRTPQQCD